MTESSQPNIQLRGQIGVYTIVHPATGQRYIGSTNDLYIRQQQHIADLRNNRHHNPNLQAAFNEVPVVDFLYYPTPNREVAYEKEQEFLDAFADDGVLFNISTSAKGASIEKTVSEETKQRIREARARQVTTPESREKAAAKIRGVPRSPEVLEKIARTKRDHPAGTPVVAGGIMYPSIQRAADAHGMSYQGAQYRIESSSERFKDWHILK